jgi:pyocin large subunit-like protein
MPFEPLELADHYRKHRADFAVSTAADYEAMAERFLASPLAPNLLECARTMGDVVRYDTMTMEYGVRSNAGIIRTYFKPAPCSSISRGARKIPCHPYADNIAYFKVSCTW